MRIDDKFGFGAAFLAVGLGAGLILLMQYWPVDPATNSNIFWPQPVEPLPAPADNKDEAARAALSKLGAEASNAALLAEIARQHPEIDTSDTASWDRRLSLLHPPKLENLHRGSTKIDGKWVRTVEPIEATCDWIVFALCVPVGIYFFYKGATSKEEPDEQPAGKQAGQRA